MTSYGMSRSTTRDIGELGSSRFTNISNLERWVSTIGGAALAIDGVRRRNWVGVLAGLAGGALVFRGLSGHCYCYELLGKSTAKHKPSTAVPAREGVKIEKTISIDRAVDELFLIWRDVENLPRVMRHLKRVEAIDDRRSRWVADGPLGTAVEWEAEIFNERKNELIAWRSLPGGDIETAGSVHFRSLGNDGGTELSISLKYNPPAGKLGDRLASFLGGGLEQELDEDIRLFKSVLEAGPAASALSESYRR